MAINQYKDGKGINDHKKGNRTKGQKRNGDGLTAISKAVSEDITTYKEIAEKVRQSRKYKQEDVLIVYQRLNTYIEEQRAIEKPLTVSGMIKASGLSKSTWYEMLQGKDYDYQLYQVLDTYNIDISCIDYEIDGTPVININVNGEEKGMMLLTWSEMLQKAMLTIEEEAELRLYEKSRVGDIFSLKSLHGWRDDGGNSPQTVNNTLVISTEDAREAIRLLEKR